MAPFTEATTGYWQTLLGPADLPSCEPPWRQGVPARLPDGRVLMLPIRPLASRADHAVASLLCNQASFEVLQALADALAGQVEPLAPDLIVGLPTLGLALAPLVAQGLGQTRFVPLGTSRKFWYDEALSAEVRSITSPGPGKRIYLDPNLLPLVRGRRVVIVDDAISTGSTALPAWDLLERLGAHVLAMGVAMRQGRRWEAALGPQRSAKLVGVFDSPLLQLAATGWMPRTD